ncbi:FAD:protein FMN transferase [Thiomicrorhabdus sp. Milos-T2]|uniref:FAD:protein FMN transferase n=1 Tax=Thiomicrorhabdus sp. Milos-T2 TaxID=90814 RepID=UPI000494243C|nr:FAD:protein FMN transferase [Thiomicrorhabdus sp. Milos-T2]
MTTTRLPSFWFIKLFIFASILTFMGCNNPPTPPIKASLIVFGTTVDITVYSADKNKANQAIHQVEQTFQTMHHEWHAWEKGGIVSKINQAIAKKTSIEIPNSVADFIIKSQKLSQQSLGLFDPGIGSLVELWGFHSENWQGPPPSAEKIQNWLNHKPSIADIKIKNNQLTSKNPYVQLDFGGNAKGLAIDIALKTLKDAGIKHALVSIGGDMKALGLKNNQAWSIGIQNPQKPSQAMAKIELKGGESIVTSGNYERYFEWQGKRYSHILDPGTGYPSNSFSSVTVIHKDATTADSAATAILVAGPKRWLAVAKSMGIEQVFCIDNQGQIRQTKQMAKRLKLL